MHDAEKLIHELRRLTPEAIRNRLPEIDGEAHALRLLLRAAVRAQSSPSGQKEVPRAR